MSDLSHNIVIKPNLFIRLFVWFWDCADVRLNTCLIFWGTIGMIVGWPFRLLGALLAPVVGPLFKRLDDHLENQRKQDLQQAIAKAHEPKRPSRGTRFLTKLSHAGSFIWYKFQTPITWSFRVLVGLASLVGVGFAIYGLSTIAWSWTILWYTLVWLGVIIGAVAVLVIFGVLYDRYQRKHRRVKRHTLRRIYRSVHDHTCANVIIENTDTGSSTIQGA